jgi:glyoxylase-like metal-dependent hydrolase (beta-lactamase superfamily II)
MATRVRIGDFEVFSLVENRMHLDGGAMFGIVPKKLWMREVPCDDQNLIPLDLNLVLIKAHGKVLLVDTGCGDVGTEKDDKIYGLSTPTRLEARLALCGIAPDQVDYVLLSHLHFDHAGGGLKRRADGRVGMRFPRARYVVNRVEWEEATHPNERTQAAYQPAYIQAYADSGQVDTITGQVELLPGITLQPTGGHTAGHQAVVIRSGSEALGYYADIFPTAAHLRTAWVAAVDTHPLETLKVKKQILKGCAEESIWVAFDHDLELKLARVESRNGHYTARPLPAERLEVVAE